MVRKRLTKLLDELNTELAKSPKLDPETTQQIEEVAAALDAYLAQQEAADEPGMVDAMHKKLLKLEVEHPRISAITGETLDLISKLGV